MVAETRARTRKGPKNKDTNPKTQRTLKDIFGSANKAPDVTVIEDSAVPVVELSDTSSHAATPPETVVTDDGSDVIPIIPSDVGGAVKEVVQPPPPKKVYSIFERRKPLEHDEPTAVLQESDHNVIHLSDDDSCTEDPTPYERSNSQHMFSVASSSMSKAREGGSRDVPILVESPLKPRGNPSRAPPSKPVYSIFASKPRAEATVVVPASSYIATPLPGREAQHVRGTQTTYSQTPIPFPRRDKGKQPLRESSNDPESWTGVYGGPSILTDPYKYPEPIDMDLNTYIEMIPRADQASPSVQRLLQHAEARTETNLLDASQEKWAEKWRPRRAEHVLGNESHALYLRDWLAALRLQSDESATPGSSQSTNTDASRKRKRSRMGKRKVVRHVKKRRRKLLEDALDDFLASDNVTDSDEEPLTAPSSDFDDLAFSDAMGFESEASSTNVSRGSSPLTGLSDDEAFAPTAPTVRRPRRFRKKLMNTILLTGQSGVGKTAAVYACAEELGYEVFEVYPGIGERNGASLNKLVGDVGKNHLVKLNRQRSPEAPASTPSFFQRRPVKPARKGLLRIPDTSDIESVPDELDIIGPSEPEPPQPELSQPSVNQSLILVEEVDILYQTDVNFWPALISIIKDCRRPVILTCNDISLVPRQDLPLQDTLHFMPCPTPLASSYLQALCLAEGRKYHRQDIASIYTNLDTTSYPIYDLRHAIDNIQMWSTKIPPTSSSLPSSPHLPVPSPDPNCIPTTSASSPLTPDNSETFTPPPLPAALSEKAMFKAMNCAREYLSFADAHLSYETNPALWNFSLLEAPTSANDELGYPILCFDKDLDMIPTSSHDHHHQHLVEEMLDLSRKLCHRENATDEPCTDLQAKQVTFGRQIYLANAGSVLQRISSSHNFVSDPALHLDLAAWIRYSIEKEEEAAQLAPTMHPGGQLRTTRNSKRTESERWVPSAVESASFLVIERDDDCTIEIDRDTTTHGAKTMQSASNGPERNDQNKVSSLSTVSSRHSPVAPLAPLEFLQNQRRGSITDPSLHAAASSSISPSAHYDYSSSNKPPSLRHPESSAPIVLTIVHAQRDLACAPHRKYKSPFASFIEVAIGRGLRRLARYVLSPETFWHLKSPTLGAEEELNEWTSTHKTPSPSPSPMSMTIRVEGRLQCSDNDCNAKGTKRKMSPDRGGQPTSNTDIDPQLIGPGVSAGMDSEGPAPKRRSSAFDTRLAQMNLYDRRNSVDARGNGQPPSNGGNSQLWNNERREGSTPGFANTPIAAGGYTNPPSSAFAADSPHGRPPPPGIATFTWPTGTPGEQAQQAPSPQQVNEVNMANNTAGPYDPALAMLPPSGAYSQDRRMSAPNISPENPSPPSSAGGPSRPLRSHSRPPSRVRASTASGSTEQSPGPSSANPEDSPITPSHLQPSQREQGATPYSRSPELRVSHKLAERKRRKEMKDLFDELRDQLPADRGMKASKWEILSKAIDFINTLKHNHGEMSREIEMLRHEVEGYRQGIPPFPPGGPVVYGHPPVGVPPFPHPPGPGVPPPPPQHHPHPQPPPPQNAPQPPHTRPESSQGGYPPGTGQAPLPPSQNGTPNPPGSRTDTPT
ncbi:hypothetical protein BDW22DRAFT_1342308 [Trametopsis cervina]|nr:hypothetical protein BDW22DRAFT_1342308 [Trametopsis cervina]